MHKLRRGLWFGFPVWLSFIASAVAQQNEPPKTAIATFAGGCFWCVEADFDKVAGVISTTSGYTGGRTPSPTYEEVSRGGAGDGEAGGDGYDPGTGGAQKSL